MTTEFLRDQELFCFENYSEKMEFQEAINDVLAESGKEHEELSFYPDLKDRVVFDAMRGIYFYKTLIAE